MFSKPDLRFHFSKLIADLDQWFIDENFGIWFSLLGMRIGSAWEIISISIFVMRYKLFVFPFHYPLFSSKRIKNLWSPVSFVYFHLYCLCVGFFIIICNSSLTTFCYSLQFLLISRLVSYFFVSVFILSWLWFKFLLFYPPFFLFTFLLLRPDGVSGWWSFRGAFCPYTIIHCDPQKFVRWRQSPPFANFFNWVSNLHEYEGSVTWIRVCL